MREYIKAYDQTDTLLASRDSLATLGPAQKIAAVPLSTNILDSLSLQAVWPRTEGFGPDAGFGSATLASERLQSVPDLL